MIETNQKKLNQAIDRIHKGESLFDITQSYPEIATEITSYFEIIKLARSIPTKSAPVPYKKRLYEQTPKSFWSSTSIWLRTVSLATLLLFVGAGLTAVYSASSNSLPNNRLYSLKRAGEDLQARLTYDPIKQTELQLELTKKRLEELKVASNGNDLNQQSLAIEALNDQTQKTLELLPNNSSNESITKEKEVLLTSLLDITKEQKKVIKTLAVKSDVSLQTTTENITKVESKQKDLAVLLAKAEGQKIENSTKVTLNGNATYNSKNNTISINGETVKISSDTQIKSLDGEIIDKSTLTGAITLNVVAINNPSSLDAKLISVLQVEDSTGNDGNGEVKSANTQTGSTKNSTSVKTKPKQTDTSATGARTSDSENTDEKETEEQNEKGPSLPQPTLNADLNAQSPTINFNQE